MMLFSDNPCQASADSDHGRPTGLFMFEDGRALVDPSVQYRARRVAARMSPSAV